MTAQPVPPPTWGQPIVDGKGRVEGWFRNFLHSMWIRSGAQTDKVDLAATAAIAAVPQTTEVVGGGGLQGGGPLAQNAGIALYHGRVDVASLPTANISIGDWAYALDGRKPGESGGAGTGVPVFWSTGAWISVCSGAAVTA